MSVLILISINKKSQILNDFCKKSIQFVKKKKKKKSVKFSKKYLIRFVFYLLEILLD